MSPGFRAAAPGLIVAAIMVGCLRDAFAPDGRRTARFALAPVFATSAAALVDFDRVRITVTRSLTGRIAADTVIPFPAAADSIDVGIAVTLEAASEVFLVFARLINAAGDTVFRNEPYPQSITAVAGRPSEVVQTLLRYVGTGFDAVAVVIATADTVVPFGQSVDLTAQAFGADGSPIPGTPVSWSSLDPLLASVPDAAAGGVVGGSTRGQARVVAQLITGPADTAHVTVQPLASLLTLVSGDGQQGRPASILGVPLRVRVTADDGLGVRVPVAFRSLTTGGAVADTLVASDANGFAETLVTLGPVAGAYAYEAAVAGLAPVAFSATAATPIATVGVTPGTLAFDALGDTVPFTAEARDSAGNVIAAAFVWTSSDGAVVSVDPATGIAVVTGNGTATITATADGVPGAAGLSVLQVATQLVFAAQPSATTAGLAITPAVEVSALDRRGNVALPFTDAVTVFRADPAACTSPPGGTVTVPAVAGVATFDDLVFTGACPSLQLGASSGTLASPASDPFDVVPGPAAALALLGGDGQVGTVATTLAQSLDVRVADQYGNAVSGHPVVWAVTGGGGLLAPTSSTTDGSGVASAAWTLGTLAGAQSVEARAGGLSGSPVAFSATADPDVAAALAFLVPPSDAVALQIIAPPLEVGVQDQYGNLVPTWTTPVSVRIGNDPTGLAVLGGLTPVTPAQGVATFADLTINAVGTGYTLVATSDVLALDESKPFNVTLVPGGPVFAGDSTDGVVSNSGVFRVGPDGSARSRLTDLGSQGDVYPRWSPDRSRVAFSADNGGVGTNALRVVDQLGGTPVGVVSDTSTRRPRWNLDGTHLAFECGPKLSPLQDVCVVPDVAGPIAGLDRRGDGAGKVFVTDFGNRADGAGSFAWDPRDPTRLVVARDGLTAKAEPVSSLYLVRFDGTLPLTLADQLVDPQTQQPLKVVSTLDWSPDGTTIVFAAQDPLATDPIAPTGQRLYAVSKDGSGLRQLTRGPAFDSQPVISPDGRFLLFLRETGCSVDYWRIGIDGTGETQVSDERLCDFDTRFLGHDWSPDGKDVVLVGTDGFGHFLIYRVPAGTTAATYQTARVLIGRGVDASAFVTDIQPSWRP